MELETIVLFINLAKKAKNWNGYRFYSDDRTISIHIEQMSHIYKELEKQGIHPPEFKLF